ncbi:hypothetical protein PVAG01_06814 [Phlyctema vagabunda]|uniref:Uncharacterized protein n=1 Tax=Phlyctema vagabunda TaxID=108571 RepID=A0ABR4PH66_9HELO
MSPMRIVTMIRSMRKAPLNAAQRQMQYHKLHSKRDEKLPSTGFSTSKDETLMDKMLEESVCFWSIFNFQHHQMFLFSREFFTPNSAPNKLLAQKKDYFNSKPKSKSKPKPRSKPESEYDPKAEPQLRDLNDIPPPTHWLL